jgi:hypothetical protein
VGVQVQGGNGVIAEVGGTAFRGLRTHRMPFEYGSNGHYRICRVTGTMAAGLANQSDIFQMRWADSTRLCVVNELHIDGLSSNSVGFTAGMVLLRAKIARAWTVDGSGGLSIDLTGNNGKVRTTMATSLMGSVRVATTAALTTGTRTETNSIGGYASAIGSVAYSGYIGTILLLSGPHARGSSGSPVILAQNEGVVVTASVPATGTWQTCFTAAWTEVDTF